MNRARLIEQIKKYLEVIQYIISYVKKTDVSR